MERAWTLNEGCLGRTCLFQFSNGTVDVQRMIERRKFTSKSSPRLASRVLSRLGRQLAELCFALQMIKSKSPRFAPIGHVSSFISQPFRDEQKECEDFAFIWNALTARSTTKREDLAIIMANLLSIKCYGTLTEGLEKTTEWR
jgi:hypothetical protein